MMKYSMAIHIESRMNNAVTDKDERALYRKLVTNV
jgi:hypothetical protein